MVQGENYPVLNSLFTVGTAEAVPDVDGPAAFWGDPFATVIGNVGAAVMFFLSVCQLPIPFQGGIC